MLSGLLARLPHKSPMLLLDHVVSVDGSRIETLSRIGPGHVMLDAGRVSSLVAIELFAQSAAALMAHRAAGTHAQSVSGALLGTRRLDTFVDGFAVGDELRTVAVEEWGQGQLAQLSCELFRGDERVAAGSINVVSGSLDVR